MEFAIPAEPVSISLQNHALRKGMNPSILSPAMSIIVGQIEGFGGLV